MHDWRFVCVAGHRSASTSGRSRSRGAGTSRPSGGKSSAAGTRPARSSRASTPITPSLRSRRSRGGTTGSSRTPSRISRGSSSGTGTSILGGCGCRHQAPRSVLKPLSSGARFNECASQLRRDARTCYAYSWLSGCHADPVFRAAGMPRPRTTGALHEEQSRGLFGGLRRQCV
jgi:hypothetical protein